MYKKENPDQVEFANFYLPFSGSLNAENRWIKQAQLIPWAYAQEEYVKSLKKTETGCPAKSSRLALGSLIIKETLCLTDRETVEQIRENPYLQFFIGLNEFSDDYPFDASMMVHFRKRFPEEVIAKINEDLLQKILADEKKRNNNDKGGNNPPEEKNAGKLLMDASCTPADIRFPTDLSLINECREKCEEIIDLLHAPSKGKVKKVRTYRKAARRDYLRVAKAKRVNSSKRRKAIGKQLNYVQRDLNHIAELSEETPLGILSKRQYKNLLVIQEVYRQQREMHENRTNKTSNRIVSISQPHVRPMVRGKSSAMTEFGAKISVSLVNGYAFLDRLSWDNYNESSDLPNQVESYKKRYGCYPESIHADKIYRTRANRNYCKELGIRFSGPALGRPPKDVSISKKQKIQQSQDEAARVPIEGKFGQCKRRFGMARIMEKLAVTSASMISICILITNLQKVLLALIYCLTQNLQRLIGNNFNALAAHASFIDQSSVLDLRMSEKTTA